MSRREQLELLKSQTQQKNPCQVVNQTVGRRSHRQREQKGMRQNGFQVYVVTRDNGEGYFSADVIREKCGTACSFPASVNGGEMKLVEQ